MATTKPVPTCPKCAKNKNSEKLSCCARNGAWFKNCGDDGDSGFDYTWNEGVEACEGEWSSSCVGARMLWMHMRTNVCLCQI